MDVLLANPRGFCAGVERAIAIVEQALEKFGAPIYVRHEVVHNRFVVDGLKAKGAVFVNELDEVPDIPGGATVIFSAHGVSKAVRTEAERRGLRIFDATCPLVTKVHLEVERHCKADREVIMIGHKGHPEVEGTMGQAHCNMHLVESAADVARLKVGVTEGNPLFGTGGTGEGTALAYVTQTTLSVDDAAAIIAALKVRFPAIVGPKKDDICYATQNRQDAVKNLALQVDLVIVVGSKNSSNSNRLREVAENLGVPAKLVDGGADINPDWLVGKVCVGVTAGASAPEILIEEVVKQLQLQGVSSIRHMDGVRETANFPLPRFD